MIRRASIVLLVASFCSTSQAGEMLSIEVEHDDGTYTMRSEVWFDASVEQVYDIFSSWDNSTKFSSAITESRDVEPDEQGRPQFYVRNKGCVLFFCTSFERSGYVEAEANVLIRAFVNPEVSDFHFSDESWRFRAEDGGTVVTYDLKMSPKFWIPPGIGPYLIKRKLRNNGGRAIDRIEILAQAVTLD
jgi:hypothetical protein